jgi:outer membrane protein assembly factor BamB
MRTLSACIGIITTVAALSSAPAGPPVTVAMSQYDVGRTGANLQERILNPSNVDAAHFGKLFSRTVDDSIYALPLIVPDLAIAGRRHNVLFVASMGNTVYAFDADDPAQSEPLWSRNLGTPAPGDSWIGPVHHGILGTPFVDVPSGTLYVVALVAKENEFNLWVSALDIHDGRPKYHSPQLLSFPFAGPEGTLTNVKGALQRAGLLVVGDVLYIAFANIVPDPNDQHWSQEGFVQTFNARDLAQRFAVFQTTPSGRKGGIWQGGRGIAADGEGNIYISTAGGSYDGVRNFGSSTLKLKGRGLELADWFTPSNHEYLFLQNIDMSAGGVTLIPDSPLMFAGGKEGVIFLLNREDMGKLEGAARGPLQRFQASHGCGRQDCAQTLGTAFWRRQHDGVLYVWDRRDVLRAYSFVNDRFVTTPAAVSSVKPGMTGGPTVSANGSDAGSGIVWAVTTQSNRSGGRNPGTLRAFRASDVSQEIYNSDMNRARDALGDFTKFAPPVVANGKVYVPTHSNAVSVYGLLGGR